MAAIGASKLVTKISGSPGRSMAMADPDAVRVSFDR
jgi:hypothetical protein